MVAECSSITAGPGMASPSGQAFAFVDFRFLELRFIEAHQAPALARAG